MPINLGWRKLILLHKLVLFLSVFDVTTSLFGKGDGLDLPRLLEVLISQSMLIRKKRRYATLTEQEVK